MNLLDKIQQERVSREHNKQVANQMLYIFDDYQDRDIYENIPKLNGKRMNRKKTKL